MARQTTIDDLNLLLSLHARSLPAYLASARPFATAKDKERILVLDRIADDNELMANRIGTVITQEGGIPSFGEFPMLFTDMHDLSLNYIEREVANRLKADIQTIQQIVKRFDQQQAYAAKAIAEEALGAAQGNLECLQESGRAQLSVANG